MPGCSSRVHIQAMVKSRGPKNSPGNTMYTSISPRYSTVRPEAVLGLDPGPRGYPKSAPVWVEIMARAGCGPILSTSIAICAVH